MSYYHQLNKSIDFASFDALIIPYRLFKIKIRRNLFPLQIKRILIYNTHVMKCTIKKNTYRAIYRLLNRVSPLSADCGQLCSAACCCCGGDGSREDSPDFEMGIYLLPGEEKLFTRKENWLKWSIEAAEDYEFPDSWSGKVYFVRCKTPPYCPREMRPLQCRFFPLAPYLAESGELRLILSPAVLPYQCPLITDEMPLQESFIKATYTVWRRLIQDPLIYDLVKIDSGELRKKRNRKKLTIIK